MTAVKPKHQPQPVHARKDEEKFELYGIEGFISDKITTIVAVPFSGYFVRNLSSHKISGQLTCPLFHGEGLPTIRGKLGETALDFKIDGADLSELMKFSFHKELQYPAYGYYERLSLWTGEYDAFRFKGEAECKVRLRLDNAAFLARNYPHVFSVD